MDPGPGAPPHRNLAYSREDVVWTVFRLLAAVGGVVLLWGAAYIIADLAAFCVIQSQVDHQLGFFYATPDTPEGETFIIGYLAAGMPMEQAGFREGDIIDLWPTSLLYAMLIQNQGGRATIPIKRGETEMDVTVEVPVLQISCPDRLLRWWLPRQMARSPSP